MVLLLPHPGLRANPAPWTCRAVILISAPGSSRVPFQASRGSLGSIPVWPCEPHFSEAAVVGEVPLMRGSPFQPEDVLRLLALLHDPGQSLCFKGLNVHYICKVSFATKYIYSQVAGIRVWTSSGGHTTRHGAQVFLIIEDTFIAPEKVTD